MFYANYMRERMKVPIYAEAEGNPIAIKDSLKRPLRDMNIFGESTQDGTPTPDAPVDIVSVENPTVKVMGKNLFDIDNVKLAGRGANDFKYTPKIENGMLYNGGVASQTVGAFCYVYCGKKPCTLSLTLNGASGGYYQYITIGQADGITEKDIFINYNILTQVRNLKDGRRSVIIQPTKDYIGFAIADQSTQYTITATDIQIECGDIATEYEPYKAKQNVILEGIALRGLKDSSGNFVARDEIVLDGVKNTVKLSTNVLEWIMDGVSNGRGPLIVNSYTSAMYTVSNFSESTPKPIKAYSGFSNYFKNRKTYYANEKDTYTVNPEGQFYIECSSISDVGNERQARTWFKERFKEGNPAIFYFAMTEPIKTDITNTEAGQKLLELYTNKGTTNISLNSESDLGEVWVRYVRK